MQTTVRPYSQLFEIDFQRGVEEELKRLVWLLPAGATLQIVFLRRQHRMDTCVGTAYGASAQKGDLDVLAIDGSSLPQFSGWAQGARKGSGVAKRVPKLLIADLSNLDWSDNRPSAVDLDRFSPVSYQSGQRPSQDQISHCRQIGIRFP